MEWAKLVGNEDNSVFIPDNKEDEKKFMKYVADMTFANLGCNKAGGNVISLWWKNDGNGKRRKTDGSGSGETDGIVYKIKDVVYPGEWENELLRNCKDVLEGEILVNGKDIRARIFKETVNTDYKKNIKNSTSKMWHWVRTGDVSHSDTAGLYGKKKMMVDGDKREYFFRLVKV